MSSRGWRSACRSPSSATSATAVMNETPRNAWSAATTGAHRHVGASCRSCSVSRVDAPLGFVNRVAIFLQRDVLRGTRETEIRQPASIRQRPPFTPRIAPPLPQQKRLQSILRLRAHADRIFARAHEIAHRFVGGIGHIDRAQFARAMQPRQHLTVPPIGFHAIPAPLGNH